jgi:apolipoprotein N-acyltransferase
MRNSVLLALLCGLLYVFSFAPWDWAHLQWFAFLPLLFSIDLLPARTGRSTWIPTFLIGLIPAVVITLGGFYWMVHATQEYGGLPFGAAVALWLIFSGVNQLQIPIYLLLRRHLYESKALSISNAFGAFQVTLMLAAAYVGIESLYPKLFLDTAGHAFYHAPWVRQWADVGGPFGITFLIICINELLYLAIRTRSLALWALIGILALIIPSYGILRLRQLETASTHDPARTLNVALVQANIGDYLKLAAERGGYEATEEVMDRYLRLSRDAASSPNPPDAIVWPETAYPAIFGQPKSTLESRMNERLFSHLKESPVSHWIGGYDSNENREEFNSLFFIKPKTEERAVYHKSILLMFGETLPLADVFPSMKSWFPTMGFFGRGPGPQVFEVTNRFGTRFRMAPSICYEGLFSDYAAQGALLGADALVNVTNDSWFGPHGEPYLHLALTQFRAIETRLPLIRSTNTGISVIVDPSGDTRAISGIGTEEVIRGEIHQPAQRSRSPYLSVSAIFGGNWFPRACQIFTLLAFWIQRARRSRQSSPTAPSGPLGVR